MFGFTPLTRLLRMIPYIKKKKKRKKKQIKVGLHNLTPSLSLESVSHQGRHTGDWSLLALSPCKRVCHKVDILVQARNAVGARVCQRLHAWFLCLMGGSRPCGVCARSFSCSNASAAESEGLEGSALFSLVSQPSSRDTIPLSSTGTSSSRCKPFPRLPQLFVRFDPPQSISCFILQLPQTSIHRPKWASLQIAFEEVLSHDWSPLAILFWRLGWD